MNQEGNCINMYISTEVEPLVLKGLITRGKFTRLQDANGRLMECIKAKHAHMHMEEVNEALSYIFKPKCMLQWAKTVEGCDDRSIVESGQSKGSIRYMLAPQVKPILAHQVR